MTAVERVINCINHKPIDRVPLDLWARADVWRALVDHFQVGSRDDVRHILGIDIVFIEAGLEDSAFAATANARVPGENSISGRLVKDHGDLTYTDQWGVGYGLSSDCSVEHIVRFPFPEANIPDNYRWPSRDGIESVESLKRRIDDLHARGFCVFGSILNPFKQAWQIRGFENFLMDLYIVPDFARELLGRLTIYSEEMAGRLAQAGADAIAIIGDVAMQDRMLFGREIFASQLTPVFGRIIASVKAKNNLPFFFHSDGNITNIMPELIKAGFSVINPIQPESMDPVEIKKMYGKDITLHGTISVQTTLPKGTEQEVRATVRRMIDLCGRDSGLILGPTNSVMNDTSLANLIAFYDEARTYSTGVYENG